MVTSSKKSARRKKEEERHHRCHHDYSSSAKTRKIFVLYVLVSTDSRRTYVGVTNDVSKRLRQHNGELAGGAKATRGKQWRVAAVADGFVSNHAALSVEKALHNKGCAMVRRHPGMSPLERRLKCVAKTLAASTPAKFVGEMKRL